MKAYVVFLRYGSLTEPGKGWHTYKQINDLTGVNRNSAATMVR